MLKLFKKTKDKIPKSEIITEPKEPKTPPVSKCGKPLLLDNTRWEASTDNQLYRTNRSPELCFGLEKVYQCRSTDIWGEFMVLLWDLLSFPVKAQFSCRVNSLFAVFNSYQLIPYIYTISLYSCLSFVLKCICHTSSRIASLLGKCFCFPGTSYDSACPKYIAPEG